MKRSVLNGQETMTTEEYFRTPETNRPSELIYGVLRVADSPLAPHQAAVFDLALALVHHVREKGLGEIWVSPLDVLLDPPRHLVVQPDLFFVSTERSPPLESQVLPEFTRTLGSMLHWS